MSRITAMLSILSDKMPPDQITATLSFVPDHTVLKGTDRNPPRPVPKSFGWYVSSAQQDIGTADEILSTLLKRLGVLFGEMQKLRDVDPDVKIEFHVSVTPYSEEVSLYFRAETISTVAKFGGSLDIEFFET